MRAQVPVDSRDALVAGILLCSAIIEALTVDVQGHRLTVVITLGVMAGSLLWRVRRPLVPVLVVSAGVIAQSAAGVAANSTITLLVVVMLTGFSAGAYLDRRHAVGALVVLAAAATTSVVLGHRPLVSNAVFALLVCAAPWGVGAAARARRAHTRAVELQRDVAERRVVEVGRQAEAEKAAAIAEERARIARELHDVVAHNLTVIGLQAGGVRRLLRAEQERERQALAVVEQASRQAQADMRRLLSLLRQHEREGLAPQPGFAELPELVMLARASGLEVDYDGPSGRSDNPRIGSGIELTVYRIVQEALTNVRRHSNATRVAVRVSCRSGDLTAEVADNGTAGGAATAPGFGLLGMRERVDLYRGTLQVGFLPGAGFRVCATIPLESVSV